MRCSAIIFAAICAYFAKSIAVKIGYQSSLLRNFSYSVTCSRVRDLRVREPIVDTTSTLQPSLVRSSTAIKYSLGVHPQTFKLRLPDTSLSLNSSDPLPVILITLRAIFDVVVTYFILVLGREVCIEYL